MIKVIASGLDLSNPVDIIVGLMGLIVVLASAVAVARASFAKAQLDALRGDRDDLVERLNIVEGENNRLKGDLKEEVSKREALEKVVTAKEEINKITQILTNHDTRAIQVEQLIKDIANKLNPGGVIPHA